MLERNPFSVSWEEDDIMVAILTNQYDSKESTSENPTKSLQTILPKHDAPQSPIALDYLHTLLPYKIKSPSITQVLMMDKVKKFQIVVGKELNINNDMTASQMTSIIQLLQDSQQAFAWDYTYMKGLDPSLCTHRIFINLECKPRDHP